MSEQSIAAQQGYRLIAPAQARILRVDYQTLLDELGRAPLEGAGQRRDDLEAVFTLPWPDGGERRFRIVESPILASELAAEFPEIRTWRGQGIDDPTATLRMDVTPAGFHAQVLGLEGAVYLDPYRWGDRTQVQAYWKKDLTRPASKEFRCQLGPSGKPVQEVIHQPTRSGGPRTPSGSTLRTYRLAIAATGEYTAFHGGTVNSAMSAIVTTMNRVNGIFEREMAIRMVLVANNNLLVYTNGGSDPYTNNSGDDMLDENQTNVDAVIGSANYDIGHVFSTGGGGIAGLGVPCLAGQKARGVTGSNSPVGDPFDIDYVAHEMGHQWGGDHTFNSTTDACENRNDSTAYEPGSGSTIQAYAGICGASNLQANSDAYFHTISFDQMVAYSTGSDGDTCAVKAATGNNPPTVEAGASFTIPKQTPFTLTGSATDPDSDALTYAWEEFDLGTASPPEGDDTAVRPIFRSFPPVSSPSRTFPRLSDLLGNTTTLGESLPQRTRTMTFRLTARDNRSGGGGVNYDSTTVNVTAAAGPFLVTAPNTAVTWVAGTSETVTWDVAGTTAAPVSCSDVAILLSLDGGQTFSTTVLASTPNDGSQSVTVPSLDTTQARLKVECVGNIFFDLSNVNFTVQSGQEPCETTLVDAGFEDGTLGPFTASSVPASPVWSNVTTSANSGTHSVFAENTDTVTDQRLTLTNPIAIPGSALAATLTFSHRYALESTFDGGVLEYSTDGGNNWNDGGSLITVNGYSGTLVDGQQDPNPLEGRQAWTGSTNGSWVAVSVNLVSLAGQSVQFRFRSGSDSSSSETGWWVDDVKVVVQQPCGGSTPTPTATPTQGVPTATATEVATATPTRPEVYTLFPSRYAAPGSAVSVEYALPPGDYQICVVPNASFTIGDVYSGSVENCVSVTATRGSGVIEVWPSATLGSFDVLTLDQDNQIVVGDDLGSGAGLVVQNLDSRFSGTALLAVLGLLALILSRRGQLKA